MKYFKKLATSFLMIMAFSLLLVPDANSQVTVNCEYIQSISAGDTTLIPTESVYTAVDRQVSTDSISDWNISGFNESILFGNKIHFDTLVSRACFAEYEPIGAGTGFRYAVHLDNIRSIQDDGSVKYIKTKIPWKEIRITGSVADLTTAWTAWRDARLE